MTASAATLRLRTVDEQLERHAIDCLARGAPVLDPAQERLLATTVFHRIFKFGRLQPLLDDERITNIHANGCDVVFASTPTAPRSRARRSPGATRS